MSQGYTSGYYLYPSGSLLTISFCGSVSLAFDSSGVISASLISILSSLNIHKDQTQNSQSQLLILMNVQSGVEQFQILYYYNIVLCCVRFSEILSFFIVHAAERCDHKLWQRCIMKRIAISLIWTERKSQSSATAPRAMPTR